MRDRTRPLVKIAALKAAAHRFSFVILLSASVALMFVGKVDTMLVEALRTRIMDATAPVMDALSRPTGAVVDVIENARGLAELRAENAKLRAENEALRQFQEAAFRLEAQNLSLRYLLNYTPQEPHRFLTARVIGDNSGAYVRSLTVNLGAENGVRDGQAVLGGAGLAGRVVQTGERSARILLLTDLNARIPVVIENTRYRAILGGDNTERPRLLYLPPETPVAVGDRIVTSGHGGLFPPGLPVGRVAQIGDRDIRVVPNEALTRLEYVRIVDFRPDNATVRFEATPGFGADTLGPAGGPPMARGVDAVTGGIRAEAFPEPATEPPAAADTARVDAAGAPPLPVARAELGGATRGADGERTRLE